MLLRPERLVRSRLRAMLRATMSRIRSLLLLLAKRGAGNALVCVGRLLGHSLLVGRLAGAAADGGEPEEAGADGEGDAEPEGDEHLAAHGGVDFVFLKCGLEDAGEGCVDGGCADSGDHGEDGLCLGGC